MRALHYLLKWTDDGGEKTENLSHGSLSLGRSQDCDITIQNKGISRKHARLSIQQGKITLEDLGSSAGTFHNGDYLVPGTPVSVIEGDRFSLGRVGFFLTLDSENQPNQKVRGLEDESFDETQLLLKNFKEVHHSAALLLQSLPNADEIIKRLKGIDSQLEKQLVQYRILQKVTQVLGQILDIKPLLKIALKLVGEELGADRGFIVLYDSAIHKMNSMVTWHFDLSNESSQHDYSFSHTLATESVKTGKILIIDNAMEDPKFQSSQSIFASRILSVICIPLFRGEEVLGVIYLDNLNKIGQFHQVHEGFLRTFARQASMALHNAKLYTQAVTDDLSGLFLRKYIERRIREEIARVQRHNGSCCLLMIDIDFFKHVNDTYGHPAGDEVITEVAKRLQVTAREMDVVGRYGGEEFIMLLPETDTKGALILAERVRKHISRATFKVDTRTFSVTASIGVSSIDPSIYMDTDIDINMNQHVETLIKSADKALYKAKSSGRNCSVIFKN